MCLTVQQEQEQTEEEIRVSITVEDTHKRKVDTRQVDMVCVNEGQNLT